jgi:hypothetical protein
MALIALLAHLNLGNHPLGRPLRGLGIETKLPRGRPCLRSQKNPNPPPAKMIN